MFGARRRGKGSGSRFGVRFSGALAAPEGFPALVTVGVGPDGAVALWAAAADAGRLYERDEDPGAASFPRTRPATAPAVALAAYADDGSPPAVTVVPALPVAFPLVQPWPDGGYLVVGARCFYRETGPEQNALVIGPDGSIRARGCLGDGIQHLLVDGAGTIWTGYFDEGVYGNFGWGGPGPTALGAAGIVRWSAELTKVWEFPQHEWTIDDCYTLNVAGPDEVWACAYSDFPVIMVNRGRVRLFRTRGVRGPHGIVVAPGRVGLIGAYGDPTLLVTGELANWRFNETGRHHLTAPDGRPLPPAQLHCRGSVAHFFVDADWYTFDLTNL